MKGKGTPRKRITSEELNFINAVVMGVFGLISLRSI